MTCMACPRQSATPRASPWQPARTWGCSDVTEGGGGQRLTSCEGALADSSCLAQARGQDPRRLLLPRACQAVCAGTVQSCHAHATAPNRASSWTGQPRTYRYTWFAFLFCVRCLSKMYLKQDQSSPGKHQLLSDAASCFISIPSSDLACTPVARAPVRKRLGVLGGLTCSVPAAARGDAEGAAGGGALPAGRASAGSEPVLKVLSAARCQKLLAAAF